MFRNAKDEVMAKRTGKPQNKLGESLYPDNTDLIMIALCMPPEKKEVRLQERADYLKRRSFEVMQDIHVKDGVFPCYDKTIIAAHAKGKALTKVMISVSRSACSPPMLNWRLF